MIEPGMMQAAIYYGQKNVSIEERPLPACGPRDILLKTVYASVCGTDAAVWRHGPGTGHRITVGSEFGHEAVCLESVWFRAWSGRSYRECGHLSGCRGAEGLLELFQDMGKINSRMVVVAVLAGKRPVDILHMTYAQKALIGSGGYFPEDVADVVETMASREYDIASIITHEFPHRELPQALELAGHPDQALNVVIRYDG